MLGGKRMKNVLLILSPFDDRYLSAMPVAELGMKLKALGATRADLTCDSHFDNSARHGNYAVRAFETIASNLSALLGQVVGKSALYDLAAPRDPRILPRANDLTSVAHISIRAINKAINPQVDARDAADLTLAFLAATHDHEYDTLVFPRLSGRAQEAWLNIARDKPSDDTGYGQPIPLTGIRNIIFKGQKPDNLVAH